MYEKLEKAVHGRRRIFEDGRVTDQVEFWVGASEQQVWASGKDWRSAIDVAVQSDPGGTFINGIVRLYARTGNTRSLVKQGRFLGPTVNRTLLVLSTRSVPCDEMIVTAQSPFPPTPPLTEDNKVRLSVGMHGFEPSPEIADITATLTAGPAANFVVSPANQPGMLYGFYATLSSAAPATRFLYFFGDATFTTPIIPPVPIAPGGIASLQLSHPFGPWADGLSWAVSDTYGTFTQSADLAVVSTVYT